MSLKDIDTFIQQFVQKCVQVIVQSRLGTKRTQTKCKPHGKDWFNLDIHDIKDICDQTTNCLKLISGQSAGGQNLSFLKKNWQICCEISLRNSDGITLVLEYWVFSNVVLNTTLEVQDAKLSQLVYQILNRMSSMLKSLITLTRSTPAYKLSSKGQSADSYVICYRVYQCADNFLATMDTISQTNQFSQVQPLGAIKSFCNEVSISLVYRTSMNMNMNSDEPNPSAAASATVLTAATAAGDDNLCDKSNALLPVKDDHFKSVEDDDIKLDAAEIFKPLNPAFADKHKDDLDQPSTTPFSALLPKDDKSFNLGDSRPENDHSSPTEQGKGEKSTPITIPTRLSPKSLSKSPQVYSTSNDSFVFVELNAPFASDDREFGSFFHGPSPTFVNNISSSVDSSDINELNSQLAELEMNAQQIDSFVESICITESAEELKFEA